MTVFCATDPMVYVPGKNDLFGRVLTGPGVDPTTNNPVAAKVDAIASVSSKTGTEATEAKAQTYFDKLKDAETAPALKAEVSVGDGEKNFTISNFTTNGTNALLKFWKTTTSAAKQVLTCVIDLTSVGKTVDTASKVNASWLDYFWNLWTGKDKTFETADFAPSTPGTPSKLTEFVKSKPGGPDGTTETNQYATTFSNIKGFVPRYHVGLSGTTPGDLLYEAKKHEMNFLVPTLIRIKNMGIDVYAITQEFHDKVWKDILALDGALETAKKGTRAAFANDDRPSQLQLDFWKVFWDETMVKIVTDQLTEEQADELVNKNLAELDRLAGEYAKA